MDQRYRQMIASEFRDCVNNMIKIVLSGRDMWDTIGGAGRYEELIDIAIPAVGHLSIWNYNPEG